MSNFRKTFNFRNGVQVDDDNLLVNPSGLVGIGTSVPTELLDVRGTAKVVGLVTASEIFGANISASGISTFGGGIVVGILSVSQSGIITATSISGVVTYYGDGGRLSNLPTSQWLDVDVGLGFTSIYAQGFVGVGTADPRFVFQVGGNTDTSVVGFSSGVGISSDGNVLITGIVTAGYFVGNGVGINSIDANQIFTGTLSNNRLPIISNDRFPANISVTGIVTANRFVGQFIGTVTGDVVGIATTARDLTSNANVTISSVNSSFAYAGISTVNTRLEVNGSVGIGTSNPQSQLHVRSSTGISSVRITGNTESSFTLGRSISDLNTASIKFANVTPALDYSNSNSLDIINNDIGNINAYLHLGSASGIHTGNFNWFVGKKSNDPLMSLTNAGNLGIGFTNPTERLKVAGVTTITSNLFVDDKLSVKGSTRLFGNLVVSPGTIDGTYVGEINRTSGISTFYDLKIINNLTSVQKIGVGNTNPNYPIQITSSVNSPGLIMDSNNIGIGTTGNVEGTLANDYGVYALSSDAIFGSVAIGATIDVDTNVNNLNVSGSTLFGGFMGVGQTGTSPTAAIDFSNAGLGINNALRYMVLPKLTTTERNNLSPVAGAIIYNTSLNQFQGYNGSSWGNL